MVSVDDNASLWPYTSRAHTVTERTLAINVLVNGDPADTRRHLEERSRGEWNETAPEQEDVSADGPVGTGAAEGNADSADGPVGTETAWGSADGSTRYVHVATDGGPASGLWLDESYQLHDGEYFGSRHHIRAYDSPNGDEWTAMQAHSEHWDWFRLSHTVDSVEESQQYVEREFIGRHYVADVTRVNLGNDKGSDANGWVTIIEFAGSDGDGESDRDSDDAPFVLATVGLLSGALLVGHVSSRPTVRTAMSPRAAHALLLAGSLIGLFLAVRFGAIAVETRLEGVDPRAIAAVFYPLLVVGFPVCTYYFARALDRPTAFAAGSVGFASATLLDYTLLGVTRLPVNVFVHRFSMAIALGFIAVGASHTVRVDPADHDFVRTGVLLWLVTLFVPLLRFL